MSFRTVAVTHRAKLNLNMGYLEVRDEDVKKIYLDDIDILIIESQAVSMTAALLSSLMDKKIKVIFCDAKRNPQGELLPYYGSSDCSRKIKRQLAWSDDTKGKIWTAIVKEKIRQQAQFLNELSMKREEEMLTSYLEEMVYRDETNREGMAAKVYFDALFGMDFKREQETAVNAALNYGYSLILSTVNREVSYNGYLTQLGLFHDNIYNCFNLSSDLMEPYRILVDRIVYAGAFERFETDEKHQMLHVLETEVKIGGSRQILPNAVRIYVRSVFDALCDNDYSEILFYTV
ncbi:MAG: type II CRISPR-associated endonuclease Cas1 [Ruminococcus flavefaciens]|nr:type II CRISPR-associated endonuclease Cas1 [Ruminococcus flavefaciens]